VELDHQVLPSVDALLRVLDETSVGRDLELAFLREARRLSARLSPVEAQA
jgi:hypothetical protein